MLQLILQFIVLFSWQSIKYCVCTHGKEWRGREWGACSAFWSGLRVFRAGSGRLLVACHPIWNCIFLNSVKHKTLLIRSTTVHNAYSETSLLTFAKGRRPGRRPPHVQKSIMFRNGLHENRARGREVFLLQYLWWGKKKSHIYSDSWASTAWKCSIVNLYFCFFLFYLYRHFVLREKTSLSSLQFLPKLPFRQLDQLSS